MKIQYEKKEDIEGLQKHEEDEFSKRKMVKKMLNLHMRILRSIFFFSFIICSSIDGVLKLITAPGKTKKKREYQKI